MKILTGTYCFMSLIGVTAGFTTPTTTSYEFSLRSHSEKIQTDCFSRRHVLASSLASVAAAGWVLSLQPAFADVSDGTALPQGAAQFSRVLKVKADLGVVSKRVKENASEIDKKEWDNIGQFLRRLYAVGDDMKAIAGGLYDPAKKDKANEDLKLLQKYAKAGEGPVNKQDGESFVAIMSKCDDLLEDFLEQLRDVPDEI